MLETSGCTASDCTIRQSLHALGVKSRKPTQLLPHMTEKFGNNSKICVHDGASCHNAKSVMEYMEEK